MSIRSRIEDAIILYTIGRPEAALLCALVAVAATSRKRRPHSTPSQRKPGKDMGDGEAFEAFLADEMPGICRVRNYHIKYRENMHRIEHVFYKWMRCSLAHEGELPHDLHFAADPEPNVIRTEIAPDGTLTLSHGWLDRLADAVVSAPENADQFGVPPALPVPIYLPHIDLTIGGEEPAAQGDDQNRMSSSGAPGGAEA
jgi:hypothetical protein